MSNAYIDRLSYISDGLTKLRADELLDLIERTTPLRRLKETDRDRESSETPVDSQPSPKKAMGDLDVVGEMKLWGATGRIIATGQSSLSGDFEILPRFLWHHAAYDLGTAGLCFAGERISSLSFVLCDDLRPDHEFLREAAIWNDPAGQVDVLKRRAAIDPACETRDFTASLPDGIGLGSEAPRSNSYPGLPVDEALFVWGSPDTLHEFRRTRGEGRSMNLVEELGIPRPASKTCYYLFDVYEKLQSELVVKLKSGSIVGSGFDNASGLGAPRLDISAERWSEFRLNCRRSVALGERFLISNIRVREAARGDAVDRTPKQFSLAAIEGWYIEWIRLHENRGETTTQAADWAEAQKVFGGRVTRDVVRTLRELHAPDDFAKRGPKPKKNR